MHPSYDTIVLGGGPAGSTAAALVAEVGHRVLLVERETMPRFHVGESLMPETYWTLKRLGVLDKLRGSAAPKKFSVQFVNGQGKASMPFYFHKHDDRECSQTWQVRRGEFDQMLFENAAEKGAECRDHTRVLDVLFDGDRATGVRLQTADGQQHEIAARAVIDATGQQSLIAHKLGIRRVNPKYKKASIWSYFRGARRDPGVDEGATIIMNTRNKETWFWFIPLSDDVVSIGVVGDVDRLLKDRDTPEEIFAAELADCPGLDDRMPGAERCDEFRVLREFSYTSERVAGDGWVLIGDAYSFLDPIYSSGVFLALKSGEMAADCLIEGLRENDLSAARLGAWSQEYDAGVHWVGKLIDAFYTNDFSFGQFAKAHPQHVGNLTDLLIGRVFHESAGDIFKDMDPWIERLAKGTVS